MIASFPSRRGRAAGPRLAVGSFAIAGVAALVLAMTAGPIAEFGRGDLVLVGIVHLAIGAALAAQPTRLAVRILGIALAAAGALVSLATLWDSALFLLEPESGLVTPDVWLWVTPIRIVGLIAYLAALRDIGRAGVAHHPTGELR